MQFKITTDTVEPKLSPLPATPNEYTAKRILEERWPPSPVTKSGQSFTFDYNHPLALQMELDRKRSKKILFTKGSELPDNWQDCQEILDELIYRIETGENEAHGLYIMVAAHGNSLAKDRIFRTDLRVPETHTDSTDIPKLQFKIQSSMDKEPSPPTIGARLFIQSTTVRKTITEETPETVGMVKAQIDAGNTDVEKIKKITRVSRFIIRKVLSTYGK